MNIGIIGAGNVGTGIADALAYLMKRAYLQYQSLLEIFVDV